MPTYPIVQVVLIHLCYSLRWTNFSAMGNELADELKTMVRQAEQAQTPLQVATDYINDHLRTLVDEGHVAQVQIGSYDWSWRYVENPKFWNYLEAATGGSHL